MQESNFSFMLLQFKDKVPNDALLPLKESLEKANEAAMEMLVFANLKNPLLALVLSLLLPGADRIYKGDMVLGLAKIIFLIAIYVSAGVMANDGVAENLSFAALMLWFACFFSAFAWVVADIFLVYRGVKRDNLTKIFEILNKTKQR